MTTDILLRVDHTTRGVTSRGTQPDGLGSLRMEHSKYRTSENRISGQLTWPRTPENIRHRFRSVSTQIQNAPTHSNTLETIQKGTMDVTLWMNWFSFSGVSQRRWSDNPEHRPSSKRACGAEFRSSLERHQRPAPGRLLDAFKSKFATSQYALGFNSKIRVA